MDGQGGKEGGNGDVVWCADRAKRGSMWARGGASKHMIKNTSTDNLHLDGNLNIISPPSVHTIEDIIPHPHSCGKD